MQNVPNVLENPDYETARDLLIEQVTPVSAEILPLPDCAGRVLAAELRAEENVPAFDRSPYDGYALRSVDSLLAAKENPVTLRILEEVPAGAVPTVSVSEGEAVKVLTGAPIPEGADAVIPFEKTEFTDETVTIFTPLKSGENVVKIGEDVQKGAVLASKGEIIDTGLSGALAAQGVAMPEVYRIPKIGIISTGNEIVEADEKPAPGKIRNSNRYSLSAALNSAGCEGVYLGIAGDSAERIAELITEGLAECDAVMLTGGVSVGDYDLTPEAMELAGVQILIRGVALKPGMACAYGIKDGKLVCGLSGNPASSLTNFYAVALPALKKLTGLREYMPKEIKVTLKTDFKKKSPAVRLLRGKIDLSDGTAKLDFPKDQGNVVLSSMIGCNVLAIVPAGSGPQSAGTVLRGFLI